MRILQVAHGYPPNERGGAELVTQTLAEALIQRGHTVAVFARTADPSAIEFSIKREGYDPRLSVGGGVPTVFRVVNNHRQISTFGMEYANPFVNESFKSVLDDFRPDVVHVQHIAHLSGEVITGAARLGYPLVLSLHDLFFACYRNHLINNNLDLCVGPDEGKRCVDCLKAVAKPEEALHRYAYFRKILRIPREVVVPSLFLARRITQIFPFLEPGLNVIGPGIPEVRRISRKTRELGVFRLACIGVLMPHKGQNLLVEAVRKLGVSSIEVSLYGGEVAECESYSRQLKKDALGLQISFAGPYEHDKLGEILANHDALVVASICEETYSLVAREALQVGLPVIASNHGALPELIENGRNGYLFRPDDAEDLLACILRLRDNVPLQEDVERSGSAVRTPELFAREMEALYDKLLSRTIPKMPTEVSHMTSSTVSATNRGQTVSLTIGLPTYNGAKYIRETLSSILEQSYEDFRVLVVDDRSEDATLDIVETFADSRIKIHRNPERLGIPGNWNQCVSLAEGEFISIFHQDDLMLPGNIEKKIAFLRAKPDVGFVHSAAEVLVEESAPRFFADWMEDEREDVVFAGLEYFLRLLLHGNRVCAPSVVVRRKELQKLGGFDKGLGFACDYDMWMRLCLAGKVGFIAESLIRYRWHGNNASHDFQFGRGTDELEEAGRRALNLYRKQTERTDGPLLTEAFTALSKQRVWAAKLEQGKAWLENDRTSWRQIAEVRDALIRELKEWIEELDGGRKWNEEHRRYCEDRIQQMDEELRTIRRGWWWRIGSKLGAVSEEHVAFERPVGRRTDD